MKLKYNSKLLRENMCMKYTYSMKPFSINFTNFAYYAKKKQKQKKTDIAYTHDAENHWFKYIGLADMCLYSYIHW